MGGSAATIFAGWLAWPKIRGEARKLEAEAETIDYDRITREVARLETIISRQGRDIDDLRGKVATLSQEKLERELENRRLLDRIAELEGMVVRSGAVKTARQGAGVSEALRSAHRIAPDAEGLRLAAQLEEGLKDVPGTGARGADSSKGNTHD
jgi:regulator of replication initiation timing